MTRSRILLVIALLVVGGCANDREEAVNDVIAFAAQAPYELDAPTNEYSGFNVVIADSALERYSALFERFTFPDTARVTWYRALPFRFLYLMPISSVESIAYTEIGDTLLAAVVFRRPNRKIFEDELHSAILVADSAKAPSADQKAAFASVLKRAKAELQETDTAFLYVLEGPAIVRLRTALQTRDSVVAETRAAEALKHLTQLVRMAKVTIEEFDDYSKSSLSGSVPTGGSIKGWVDPNPVGWYVEEGIYTGTWVECEGRRDNLVTRETSYVALSGASNQEDDFLCIWIGADGASWVRTDPTSVRVRLVAFVDRDTVFGAWTSVK
jgi:hypothetical protein